MGVLVRRGPAVAAGCVAVVAALLMVVSIVRLQTAATRAERSARTLEQLRVDLAEVESLAWQRVAQPSERSSLQARLSRLSAETVSKAERLPRDLWATVTVPLRDAVGSLSRAALADDDSSRRASNLARRADQQLGDALADRVRSADRATRIARVLRVGVVALLLSLIGAAAAAVAAARQLAHDGLFDPLTGFPNRLLVEDRLSVALTLAGRSGEQVAVLSVMVDGLLQAKGRHGHPVADDLSAAIGHRIASVARTSDTVGLVGTGEYVVVLHVSDEPGARAVAKRILAALARPLIVGDATHTLRTTIGIALSRSGDSSAQGLMRDADLAADSGRANDQDLVVYRPPMRRAVARKRKLENDLASALTAGTIGVAYQPIVELATGQVRGAEALARWTHPSRGVIPPTDFIGVAEQSDLIHRLGRHVLTQAATTAARRRHLEIHVNVSPVQVRDRTILGDLADLTSRTGCNLSALTLEITESALADRNERFLETLDAIRSLGVRLAIDDFGTGHSSVAFLSQLQVDTLKIDRSFIADIASNPRSMALTRTIVELGNALDLATVAEGIETDAQAEILDRLGCRYGQGYLYGNAALVQPAEPKVA